MPFGSRSGLASRLGAAAFAAFAFALTAMGAIGIHDAAQDRRLARIQDVAESDEAIVAAARAAAATHRFLPERRAARRVLAMVRLGATTARRRHDDRTEQLLRREATATIDAALGAAPAAPGFWFDRGEALLHRDGAARRAFDAIELSYLLGAHEGRLTPRRLAVGLALDEALPPPLRRRLEREYETQLTATKTYEPLHVVLPELYAYFSRTPRNKAMLDRGLALMPQDYRDHFHRAAEAFRHRLRERGVLVDDPASPAAKGSL